MTAKTIVMAVLGLGAVVGVTWSARAEVVMETVTVGNPGNANDPPGYGGVDYTYNIGKYEVTAGQYTAFLNAVAETDTYGLYNTSMWSISYGCKIDRGGTSGSYTYSVAGDWANRPVNYVNWYDALRFANWMHNGQPAGAQDTSTTEDGAYDMSLGASAVRKPGARFFLPTENEWYKAAYHKNDGVTGNYWDYPTATDLAPNNGNPEGDTGNSANFSDGDSTIGSPYWRTPAGYFGLSGSAYGTFDMGGNIWEWNEALIGWFRGIRGGSFEYSGDFLRAAQRLEGYPSGEHDFGIGFRIAQVPEPATLSLLAVGCLLTVRRRR